jgi:hypothetical protein
MAGSAALGSEPLPRKHAMKPTTRRRILALTLLTLTAAAVVLVWRVERQRRLDNALAAAVVRLDAAGVRKALRHGADVNVRIPEGGKDARSGLQFWMDLLTGRRVTSPAALEYFIEEGDMEQLDIACALVEGGANPNAQSHNGNTALMRAARVQNVRVSQLLISRGANPNIQNADMWTAFTFAMLDAPKTNTRTVALLVDAGYDVNSTDASGMKPIMRAALLGDLALVELLLNRGADPRVTWEGKTSLDRCLELPLHERSERVIARLKAAEKKWRRATAHNSPRT